MVKNSYCNQLLLAMNHIRMPKKWSDQSPAGTVPMPMFTWAFLSPRSGSGYPA